MKRTDPAETPRSRGQAWHNWLAAALIVVFVVQVGAESRLKSPVADEPPHIASGLAYVAKHNFRGNPEHPPLLKELAGVSMLAGGIRWPRDSIADSLLIGSRPPGVEPEWELGNRIIATNNPDRVLFWARLPLIAVATMLAVLIFVWGRELVGPAAALGALFVFTTDPTILAHAFPVTTDVGLAAFTVLFLFALWRYTANPSRARLVLCGVALGAMLCAKFSAVLLLPVLPILMLAAARWPRATNRPRAWLDPFHTKLDAGQCRIALCAFACVAMGIVAVFVIQAVYLFSKDPLLYVHGLGLVNANHKPDFKAYLAGDMQHRFIAYFPIAYALKQPLASIALTLAGLVILLRSTTITPLAKVFIILPAVVLFAGPALLAEQIGVRYLVPTFPFAHLLAGVTLAALLTRGRVWARGVAVAACAWLLLADGGIFPDHLAYFNEAACLLTKPERVGVDGGTRCGAYWLADSNVDWGQGERQLKAWAERTSEKRVIRYATLYGFPASAYGLSEERPPESELLGNPVPGQVYAISSAILAVLNALPGTDWPDTRAPTAIVGHSG